MEISFSRFRIFRECPWKYKLQFVDGRRIPLDPPSSLGVSLHRALERYHRRGQPEWRALADAYEEEFLRAGYPDAETRDQWSQKGLRILKKYHEAERGRRTEIVGNEREFFYPLGRHTVRGMVDRIDRHSDGRFEIIDYKTSLSLEPMAEAADLQLRFYALGVKESFGYEPALLTVHSLAAGKAETRPYDPSGEEALKREIEAAADAIESREFKPDASFCARCGFRRDCAFSAARD